MWSGKCGAVSRRDRFTSLGMSLVPQDAQRPSREIDRRSCTEDDPKLPHQHLVT